MVKMWKNFLLRDEEVDRLLFNSSKKERFIFIDPISMKKETIRGRK